MTTATLERPSVDWTTATHLDAPALAAWLIERGELNEAADPTWARRLRCWANGEILRVRIWTADELLTRHGYLLAELPDELFCGAPDERPTAQAGAPASDSLSVAGAEPSGVGG